MRGGMRPASTQGLRMNSGGRTDASVSQTGTKPGAAPLDEHRTGGRSSPTVFGHLGDDVGHPGGAAGLGLQQTGKERENPRLLDLHTGLGVWTGEMMSH